MQIIPVTVLAGTAGRTTAMHARLAGDRELLLVADEGSVNASPDCTCCAISDGLTRALREAHFAKAEGHGRPFTRVVVDASGVDPRPALAALARTPLAALRLALSTIVTTVGETDPLARALADAEIDPASASAGDLFAPGLYRQGAPDASGWLDRALVARHVWSRPEPWDGADVEPAVQAIQLAAGDGLLRLKGLVHVAGEPGPRLVQAFGHTRYPSARLAAWPDTRRETTLLLATRPLEFGPIARILDSIPSRP
jgi:G3E family GTPase